MIAANKVKQACENKLNIDFGSGHELTGWYYINNIKACRVTVSKGNNDIPPKTLRRIAQSLYLEDDELITFARCKLSGKDIQQIVAERKPIPPV